MSCEQDVKRVLAECEKTGKSVTFKAGGTSLSGQTITDSVLMEISPDYGKVKISGDGSLAKFPCGITGEEANRWLSLMAANWVLACLHQIRTYRWDRSE